MHPQLFAHYQKLADTYGPEPAYLEIGAAPGGRAILAGPWFADRPERVAINLNAHEQAEGIAFRRANANDLSGVFADGAFRSVFSNAVLEHDKAFWRSLAEMKRVLAPGGLMFVGAPGFIPSRQTRARIDGFEGAAKATITFDVHAKPDYWRFSRQAFKEVVFDGLELLELKVVGRIPRLVGVGRKPG